jgi:hypothetical protein
VHIKDLLLKNSLAPTFVHLDPTLTSAFAEGKA